MSCPAGPPTAAWCRSFARAGQAHCSVADRTRSQITAAPELLGRRGRRLESCHPDQTGLIRTTGPSDESGPVDDLVAGGGVLRVKGVALADAAPALRDARTL